MSAKIKIRPQTPQRSNQNRKFNISELKVSDRQIEFAAIYQSTKPTKSAISVSGKWSEIKASMTKAATSVLGQAHKTNADYRTVIVHCNCDVRGK